MDYNNSWFERHLISGTDNLETMPLNISKESKGNNFRNWFTNPLDFKTKIESSSSSTTHISDNICISQSVSMGESLQTHLHDDEEWANSMGTCLSRTLDGNFGDLTLNCPREASSQEQLEENLNNYLAKTFGIYNETYANKLQGINSRNDEKKFKEPFEIMKAFNGTQLCTEQAVKSNSPEGTVIFNPNNQNGIITISNVSTDCGICGFPPVTNTSPSSGSQFSDHTKNSATNLCSAINGFNTPYDILSDSISVSANANDASVKGTYGSCASSGSINDLNVSNASNFSFGSSLLGQGNQQMAGSFLGDIFPGNNVSQSSEITSETKENPYSSFNFMGKDLNANIGENYYKTPRHDKDIDLIFNNMDSMSRVDNLLNKDITDFGLHAKDFGLDVIDLHSDGVNDLLNNDALFSEIYRDNEDPEGWDNLMKRLSISNSLTKYDMTPINEQSNNISGSSSYANINFSTAEGSEFGINMKNRDNLPTVLPSDPNLGFKKTSLCKYWQRGICANDDCNFAHGKKELRSTIGVWRTTICHHWKTGICRVGKDCRHAHGEEELQPKNIPANVLKNKLLNSARKYEYMRKKKNTY